MILTQTRNVTTDGLDSLNSCSTNIPLNETMGVWTNSANTYRSQDAERKRITAALKCLDEAEIRVDEQSKLIKGSKNYDFMLPMTRFQAIQSALRMVILEI